MAGGRPSKYTPEIAEAFCKRMGEGELAIDICAEDGMPSLGTLFVWREKYPEFLELYARARVSQGHAAAERAVRSGRRATSENAQAARVQFDADRWLASKLLANVYGDRLATQQLDKDGNPTDPAVPKLEISIKRDV